MYAAEYNYFYRKQMYVSEMMLHQGIIESRDEFFQKYADRFRAVYEKKGGQVCVDDLLN